MTKKMKNLSGPVELNIPITVEGLTQHVSPPEFGEALHESAEISPEAWEALEKAFGPKLGKVFGKSVIGPRGGLDLRALAKKEAQAKNEADGKRLCGLCAHKVPGIWQCTSYGSRPCPWPRPDDGCSFFTQKPSKNKPQSKPARLKIPEGVRFLYFGQPLGEEYRNSSIRPCHQGVMTVAYRVLPQHSLVEVGFSFCSPRDRWVKAKGQDLALQRLCNTPAVAAYLYQPRRVVAEIAQALLLHDFDKLFQFAHLPVQFPVREKVPGWSRDLAKRLKERPVLVRRSGFSRLKRGKQEVEAILSYPIMLRMLTDIAKLDKVIMERGRL